MSVRGANISSTCTANCSRHAAKTVVRCWAGRVISPAARAAVRVGRLAACARISVWFGEYPLEMDRITTALKKADLFVSIGTSGVVYPAAGFAAQAAANGKCLLIEVNKDSTAISQHFQQRITGPASIEVPKLVDAILAGASLCDVMSD